MGSHVVSGDNQHFDLGRALGGRAGWGKAQQGKADQGRNGRLHGGSLVHGMGFSVSVDTLNAGLGLSPAIADGCN
jgi:hypothetical protein